MYRWIKEEDLNEYEKENKRLSYKNLFYNDDSLILCNNIVNQYEYLEQISGVNDDECEYDEIYQYYIIDDDTAKRLIDIDEIVFYHNDLDIYILGVTHYGTSWGYVLTDITLKESDTKNWYIAYKTAQRDEEIEAVENEKSNL